jgi:eukaryotic-like serine/threonine-protein kinase
MWSSGVTLGQRYELEERVGAGGFSEVWRARDLILNRPVAVKLLHVSYIQEAEALARFRAEARHAGSLADDNIARVYDYGESDPPYLVMELVDGPSLARVLVGGPLDPVRTMDLVAQTAAGLRAAHLSGLVHRDIKPANLMLTPGGIMKITDFGISQAVGSAPITSSGLVVGTPGYLAPERAGGASATAASDLYSLGAVAYECLTGVPPFSGTAMEIALAHAMRPFPALPDSVPADVAALVAQLTAKDPADRPASAGEVAGRARQLADRLMAGSSSTASRPENVHADESSMPARRMASIPGWNSSRLRLGAALVGVASVLAAVVTLAGGTTGSSGSAVHPVATPSSRPSTPKLRTAVTADVNAATLIGQPVSVVVQRLLQQKLIPRILWLPTDRQQPGRVAAIQPAGDLPVGSIVTVVGALAIPASAATSQQAGNVKDSGNGQDDGNGKGNGNGNGKGKGDG